MTTIIEFVCNKCNRPTSGVIISDNGRLSVFVCKDLFGDHYPGEQKELDIIYTFNGVLSRAVIKEHDTLSIPCFDTGQASPWRSNMHYIILLAQILTFWVLASLLRK